jgi:hypothetical protein
MFVLGGDTQDKGIGDIRFTKLLLALKQEHPDRVQLIIGNRDANKLRLAAELHADCIDDARVRTGTQFTCFTGTKSTNTDAAVRLRLEQMLSSHTGWRQRSG